MAKISSARISCGLLLVEFLELFHLGQAGSPGDDDLLAIVGAQRQDRRNLEQVGYVLIDSGVALPILQSAQQLLGCPIHVLYVPIQ